MAKSHRGFELFLRSARPLLARHHGAGSVGPLVDAARVEYERLLPEVPRPSIELSGYRNKVFRSDTLTEISISNLYSEIVALDI